MKKIKHIINGRVILRTPTIEEVKHEELRRRWEGVGVKTFRNETNTFVADKTLFHSNEEIPFGSYIDLTFMGSPSNFPYPWILVSAHNKFSTVTYSNVVTAIIRADNGEELEIDNIRWHSPRLRKRKMETQDEFMTGCSKEALKIVKAFGIDLENRITNVVIRIPVGDVVTIEVERLGDLNIETQEIETICEEYELRKKNENKN